MGTAQHNKISSRREAAIINRLRLGHCRLTHSYLMSGDDQPVCESCRLRRLLLTVITPSPHKAEKLALHTVTNSCKAKIPACRSLMYSRKTKYRLGNLEEKLLQIMLCLGAVGLATPHCGSSGVRGLNIQNWSVVSGSEIVGVCLFEVSDTCN